MTDRIIRLTAADYSEAIAFLNRIFSVYAPHDFANMLPGIYRATDAHMAHNYAVKRNGRIAAIVGMFPVQWRVGDRTFRVAGIGGVSTDPDHRGAGLMQALMAHCLRRMDGQGFHLSYLGGQRQRYLHYGYDRCGIQPVCTLNRTNVRAFFSGEPDLNFAPLDRTAQPRVLQAWKLHAAQPVHGVRARKDFYSYLLAWHHRPHAILDRAGRMVGYLVANQKKDFVAELVAEDGDTAWRAIAAWVLKESPGSVVVETYPLAGGLLRGLAQYSENVTAGASGNWRVMDWAAVTDALLRVQQSQGALPDGAVVVGIREYGAIRLQVGSGKASCRRVKAPPDVECDAPTAMRLLFGPLPPDLVLDLPRAARALQSWCPLPLGFARQDSV